MLHCEHLYQHEASDDSQGHRGTKGLMIRTHIFPCRLSKDEADALNRESGRVYTLTLVWHYRIYRRKGIWLSPGAAERLGDRMASTTLHAHSRDAAQQAFYKACKTAKANRHLGVKYPHKGKRWRTTVWKNTGIRKHDDVLLLSQARGLEPITVTLPSNLATLPLEAFRETRLVWDRAARRYFWHIVIENGQEPAPAPGDSVAAVDLGEIHPAAVTDGQEAVIFSARALRSLRQYTAKRLASISRAQAAKAKGSRAWQRLQRRRNRFLAQQKRRTRDIEHKVSRAVVHWAVERKVGTLVIGDVRDVANGKRLNGKSQQKIGLWSHGRQRGYITYKAEAQGVVVPEPEDEAHSSQTCPRCKCRYKPTGRVYCCPACGFCAPRDTVGSVNILSRHKYGEVGFILPPEVTKYRRPFVIERSRRSPLDTGQVAAAGRSSTHKSAEAAGL